MINDYALTSNGQTTDGERFKFQLSDSITMEELYFLNRSHHRSSHAQAQVGTVGGGGSTGVHTGAAPSCLANDIIVENIITR